MKHLQEGDSKEARPQKNKTFKEKARRARDYEPSQLEVGDFGYAKCREKFKQFLVIAELTQKRALRISAIDALSDRVDASTLQEHVRCCLRLSPTESAQVALRCSTHFE